MTVPRLPEALLLVFSLFLSFAGAISVVLASSSWTPGSVLWTCLSCCWAHPAESRVWLSYFLVLNFRLILCKFSFAEFLIIFI